LRRITWLRGPLGGVTEDARTANGSSRSTASS